MTIIKVTLVKVAMFSLAVSWGFGADRPSEGLPQAAAGAEAIVGHYFRGNGLAYNLHLRLQSAGHYEAAWHSCLYKSGKASGTWTFFENRVTLKPALQGEMLRFPVETLEVLKFNDQLILVPVDERDREVYSKAGVTKFSCFQRIGSLANVIGSWHNENGLMGEFSTLDLRPGGNFTWIARDEPLHAEDTFYGEWKIQEDRVHLLFKNGRTNLGALIPPAKEERIFSIEPDDLGSLSLIGDTKFRLARTPPR
jgi:hypothetical protein